MTEMIAEPLVREERDPGLAMHAMQPRARPPDRRRFQRDMEACTSSIGILETELKSLNLRGEDSIQGELRNIRADKESTINRRKRTDMDLRMLNQAISKQMDSLTKVQSNLAYKDEARINSAIRRMEDQLKTNNFRLSEEKKIVAEIDRLRRSKKALVQYTALKQEIDSMRDDQRRMREQRDRLYKEVTSLKTREEDIKRRTADCKVRSEELKRELDELYERKRQIHANFKQQEREYYSVRDELRRKKREEEKRAQDEQYEQDLAEYEASREPYADEKQLCATLIAYLQRFPTPSESEPTSHMYSSSIPGHEQSPPAPGPELENNGMYILRKKTDVEMYGGVRPKTNKRSRREKRKPQVKNITHTPQVFGDFGTLGLEAPMTLGDVPGSLQQLQEKKHFYDSLPAPNNPDIIIIPGQSDSSGSAGTPSVAESAICESMPSTPEVQLENTAPNFPRIEPMDRIRKLSHDSGACELEEQITLDDNLLVGEATFGSALDSLSTGSMGPAQVLRIQDSNCNLPLRGPDLGLHIGGPLLSLQGSVEPVVTLGCEHRVDSSTCGSHQMASLDRDNNMSSALAMEAWEVSSSQISQEGSCSSASSNSTSTSDQTVVLQHGTELDHLQDQTEGLGRVQTTL